LNEKYLEILLSLQAQLQRETLHRETLDKLVDMVDLSKLDQTV